MNHKLTFALTHSAALWAGVEINRQHAVSGKRIRRNGQNESAPRTKTRQNRLSKTTIIHSRHQNPLPEGGRCTGAKTRIVVCVSAGLVCDGRCKLGILLTKHPCRNHCRPMCLMPVVIGVRDVKEKKLRSADPRLVVEAIRNYSGVFIVSSSRNDNNSYRLKTALNFIGVNTKPFCPIPPLHPFLLGGQTGANNNNRVGRGSYGHLQPIRPIGTRFSLPPAQRQDRDDLRLPML